MEEKNDFKDDTFLARWLQGQLSEEEKAGFESNEAYQQYRQIIEASDKLNPPPYDTSKAYEQLKDKRAVVHSLKKKRSWLPYAAIAASILLLASAFWVLRPIPDEQFITLTGEQKSINLPDNSSVLLNAASELSFNPKSWKKNRMVQLNGEAFFSVQKGSKFSVQTNNGEVVVLGTSFNVWNRAKAMEVTCFSGLVKISRSLKNMELSKGMKARWSQDDWVSDTIIAIPEGPSWSTGTVDFEAVPLSRVLQELKHHYNIKITFVGSPNRTYTGGFPTNNLEAALENISEPMGLSFQVVNQQEIIFREE